MNKVNIFKKREKLIVPLIFITLIIICYFLSKVSPLFLLEQVPIRFIRNGILVLSLLIPINAGMGLNFSIVVGAMSAQIAFILTLNHNLTGLKGVIFALILTVIFGIIIGVILGKIMNLVKGREMITSIVVSFLANYIYQLIFLVGFGNIFPINNKSITLPSRKGIKNLVDLKTFKSFFDSFGTVQIGGSTVSVFLIIVVLSFCFLMYLFSKTKLGMKIKVMGLNNEVAVSQGIDIDKTRIKVMVLSTTLAGLGQFFYLQNIGSLSVYTEHFNADIFSCASLLAGGASIKSANVRNVIIGIFLMHTLFILSPLAGQNSFSNIALGEYFRTFVVYGVIAFALIMNIKIENEKRG